jgi:acetyl-CoA synthetase
MVMNTWVMVDYEETYRNFSLAVPEYFNFGFDVVDAWAREEPGHLAYLWVNDRGEQRRATFGEVQERSDSTAQFLYSKGIRPGDRIILLLPRVPDWWIFCIAIMKLGAVFCPCPTMLTSQDLLYRIHTAESKVVITDGENAHKIDEIQQGCPSLEKKILIDGERPGWLSSHEINGYGARERKPGWGASTRSDDPMVIYFTSGTTGEPKMVLHPHSLALGHITTGAFWLDIKRGDLHFTLSDTGWAKSSWGKLFGPWLMGAATFIYDFRDKFNPVHLLRVLSEYPVTTFCAPPTAYRMLILEDLARYDLSTIRHCTSAGEPLNPEVIRVWKQATGCVIREGYGQTETTCCIAMFPCLDVKPGSMGKPAPGWKIELHDDEGRQVGPTVEGLIAVGLDNRPIGLFTEYLNNEKANNEAFSDGFYYTGDKAYADEEGYFWFLGRADDVITSSGYRIGPFEVESALLEHPAVKESAVIGSPDPLRGEIVEAYIVLNPGFEPSENLVLELQEHVKHTTAPYKYPRKIVFAQKLPKTISGKIKRYLLREESKGRG